MTDDDLRALYTAFNARDVDGVLAWLTPDVAWPKAFEGGSVVGHEAVREYWARQWSEIDPTVIPTAITERPDGTRAVTVRQTVRDLQGGLVGEGETTHVYAIRDGLVSRMTVEA